MKKRNLVAVLAAFLSAFVLVVTGTFAATPAHAEEVADTLRVTIAASGTVTVTNPSQITLTDCKVYRDRLDVPATLGSVAKIDPGYSGTFRLDVSVEDGLGVYVQCVPPGGTQRVTVGSATYRAPSPTKAYAVVIWKATKWPESSWPQQLVDARVGLSKPNLALFDATLKGQCVYYQVDAYYYNEADGSKAKVDALIKGRVLNGPGNPPEPHIPGGAGKAYKTWVNKKCGQSSPKKVVLKVQVDKYATTTSYLRGKAAGYDNDGLLKKREDRPHYGKSVWEIVTVTGTTETTKAEWIAKINKATKKVPNLKSGKKWTVKAIKKAKAKAITQAWVISGDGMPTAWYAGHTKTGVAQRHFASNR